MTLYLWLNQLFYLSYFLSVILNSGYKSPSDGPDSLSLIVGSLESGLLVSGRSRRPLYKRPSSPMMSTCTDQTKRIEIT